MKKKSGICDPRKTPLYDAVFSVNDFSRFHTPGHKGNSGFYGSIEKADLTELSVTDDLYLPSGPIAEAERFVSDFFGTVNTVFSAGGATLCIQTALSFFKGKKILFDRNVHCSAISAAALLDISPCFIYNSFDRNFEIPLPPDPEKIREKLKSGCFSAVFITSPTYFGLCAEVKKIKQICKESDCILIIDNSHGSHIFLTDRENSAEKNGDICISSAHKTLPVLTGGAYLHFNYYVCGDKNLATEERFRLSSLEIKKHMRFFGSTSPSFPVLASLDKAGAWCESYGEKAFAETGQKVLFLKTELKRLGISCLDTAPSDNCRLTINCTSNGYGGKKLASLLEKNDIFPEMADERNVVFLFTPFNKAEDYSKIIEFFHGLDNITPEKLSFTLMAESFPQLEMELSLKDAMFSEKERIFLRNTSPDLCYEAKISEKEAFIKRITGRVSAGLVFPYPPGVPVLIYGEKITAQAAEYLYESGYSEYIDVVK